MAGARARERDAGRGVDGAEPSADSTRRVRTHLGARAALALGLCAVLERAIVLLGLWRADPLARVPISDAAHYREWALALATGEPWRAGLAHWLPPLYPWFLAALARAGLPLPGGALVVQGLLGAAVVLGVAWLAARTAGRAAGIAAGVLWLLYAPVVLHESRLLGVALALPLGGLALAGLVVGRERLAAARPAGGILLGAGVAGGLAVLAHPNLLIATPIAALGVFAGSTLGRGRRALGAFALVAGFALGLAPGPISNMLRAERFVIATANGGVNFGLANRPGAAGTFVAPGPQWGSIERQRDVAIAEASQALGRPVDEAEASRFWFRRGLDWIVSEPLAAATLMGRKLVASLSSGELDVQVDLNASRAEAPILWTPFLPFGVLLALAILGARGVHSGRLVLLLWIAAGLISTLLYFHYPRFRLLWMLGLMPFAGAGVAVCIGALRGGPRPSPVSVALALLACALSFVPLEGTLPARQEAHARVDSGAAWLVLGRPDRARASFEAALTTYPGEVRARVELARFERNEGRRESARARLLEAIAMPVDYPRAILDLVYLELGSPDPSERARGDERARRWLAAASANHPDRPSFEIAAITSLLDRARQSAPGPGRDVLLGEAGARLAAQGVPAAGVRDARALLADEIERLRAR